MPAFMAGLIFFGILFVLVNIDNRAIRATCACSILRMRDIEPGERRGAGAAASCQAERHACAAEENKNIDVK